MFRRYYHQVASVLEVVPFIMRLRPCRVYRPRGYLLGSATPNRWWCGDSGECVMRDLERLLHKPEEQFATRGGKPSVEAESEFIEIVVEMGVGNRPLVRTEQPTFQQ